MKIKNKALLFLTKAYAHGVWKPLACATLICLCTFGSILLIDIFSGSSISFGRIIELMLDPGAFSSTEEPATVFQLVITIIGAVVFTSLLITTISNMFSNIAEAYRNGESNISLDDLIIIVGTNQIFYNSLDYFLSLKGDKVILTSVPAKEARSQISAHIGSDKANDFVIVTGDRRLDENLRRISFWDAKQIFILGEGNESDHDAANISCLKKLCKREKKNTIKCLIQIDSPEVDFLFSQTKFDLKNINLTCFNPQELLANSVLLNEHDAGIQLEYLESDDIRSHHLIVIGTSSISTEIAKLYLSIAHYPNYETNKKRSKLTIIDDNDALSLGLQSNLKDISHIHEYGAGLESEDSINTYDYFDILDFEINHIKGRVLDHHVRKVLERICDSNDIVHIIISSNDTDQNFKDSISLPYFVYEKDFPVCVYQPVTGLVIDQDNLPDYYDNLKQFGLNVSVKEAYTRQYRNILRASAYADNVICHPSRSESLIYDYDDELLDGLMMNQNKTIEIQKHNISTGTFIMYLMKNHPGVDITNLSYFINMLHQNWMAFRLLYGHRMMTKQELLDFCKIMLDGNSDIAKSEIRNLRIKYHQNFYIAPYAMLPHYLHEYDLSYSKSIYTYLRIKHFGIK